MSTTVDNRVVQMEFDNRRFESNVETSMSTLDKLKKALNLDNAAKGLSGISAAAKKVDMNPIGRAAETVGLKFNALYTVADQALRNITNSAMNYGKRIVSALTLEPVKTGFSEYETKIGSIQTIMSNTASKGTTMADVTQVIDELNTYADKTIYNFAEMTRNIGTFTAAGVGLEESAAAIQGIANLAAASGSTSQQASTAMYQLSQALAAGSVKLTDWNSVVNAGMGGEKFQEALKATARDHGVAVDEIIEKNGSFRESLSEGWISADILNETLNKFTVEGAKNYAKSMMDSGKWTQKQADALIKEAQAMEDAATKVKTFTQLWDTLKESAQSGWGKTWELIVGDFESAKEMWTGVSNVLGGIIEKSANARNDAIEGALTSNWGKLTKEVNAAGIETKEFEEIVKNVARNEGYNVDKLIEEYGSLENVFHKGAIQSWVLKRALNGVGDSTADLSKVARDLTFNMKGEDVKQVEEALLSLGYTLTGKDGKFYGDDGYYGTLTRDAVKAFQEVEGLKVTGIVDDETLKALKEATKGASIFDGELDELANSVTELSGRQKLLIGFKYFFKGFKNILEPVGKAFREVFPRTTSDQISGLIDKFYDLSASFVTFTGSVKGQKVIAGITAIFKTLFSVIDLGITVVKEVVSAISGLLFKGLLKGVQGIGLFTGSFAESVEGITEWIKSTGFIPAVIGMITGWLQNGIEKIKNFAVSTKESAGAFMDSFGGFGGFIERVFGAPFALAIKKLGEFFGRVKNFKKFNVNTLSFMFADFKTNVIEYFKKIDPKEFFTNFLNSIKRFVSYIKTGLGSAEGVFGKIISKLGEFGKSLKENLTDNIGGIIAVGVLAVLFVMVNKIKKAFEALTSPLGFLDDLSGTLQGLGKSLKFGVKAEAIKDIAVAIAVLAASVAVLALLPYGKVWSAVGAIAVLSGMLVGVVVALDKLTKDTSKLMKVMSTVMMLAGALLILGIAAKVIASINDGALVKCITIMGGFIGAVLLIMKGVNKKDYVNMATFGAMILGIAQALLVMSIAVKILGSMDGATLLKGGIAVVTFLGMMVGMMAATKLLGSHLPKFGAMMAGIAGALLIFAVVTGILGRMRADVLVKGILAINAFLLMMVGMMAATKLISKGMPKFGATMMGMSVGLLALAVTAKILSKIDTASLAKGVIVIGTFLTMMALMMAATKLLGTNSSNSGKFGLMMIGFAGSMLLLTGAIAMIAMLKPSDVAKAVATIAAVSLMFVGLMAATKLINVSEKTTSIIFALSIAIGILAVSLAALSLVKTEKLEEATAALSIIMLSFAGLIMSTKLLKGGTFKSIGTLVVMVGAIVLLVEVLKDLAALNPDAVIKTAASLSAVILSLAGAALMVGAVGKIGAAALWGVAVFGLLGVVVGLLATWAVSSLPAIGKKLAEFALHALPFFMLIRTVKGDVGTGIKNLAEGILALAKASFIDKLTSLGGESSLATFGTQLASLADGLSDFLGKVSSPLDANGKAVEVNFDNIDRAIGIAVRLGELAASIPVNSGAITKLANKDLGEFGTQVSSFAEGLNSYLVKISDPFAGLKDESGNSVSLNFENIEKATDIGFKLADMAATIPVTSGKITSFAKKDLGAFGTQAASFATGLSSYLATMSSPIKEITTNAEGEEVTTEKALNYEQITFATDIGVRLAEIAKSIPATEGLMADLEGKDLGEFGTQVSKFATGLNTYLTTFGTQLVKLNENTGEEMAVESLDTEQITLATDTGVKLAEMAKTIPATEGLMGDLEGKDLGAFGTQVSAFADGLTKYLTTMGTPIKEITTSTNGEEIASDKTIDYDQVTLATDAGVKLATMAEKIPATDGLMKNLEGKDLGAFGTQVSNFATGLHSYLTTMSEPIKSIATDAEGNEVVTENPIDIEKIGSITDVGVKLAEMADKIPEKTVWSKYFGGEKDLEGFGTEIGTFAGGLKSFMQTMSTVNIDADGNNITIDETAIDNAIRAAEKLAGLGTTVATDSAGWDWITGKDSLGDFGTNVESLGSSLSKFSGSVSGENMDFTAVTSAMTEIEKIAAIGSTIGGEDFGDLGGFATDIGSLGKKLSNFYKNIDEIDTTKLSAATDAISSLAAINVSDASTLQSFLDSLGSVGTDGLNSFVNSIFVSSSDVLTEATTLGEKVVEGITTGMGSPSSYFKSTMEAARTTIRSYRTKFRLSGEYVVQGLTQGIRNGKSGAINEIVLLARKLLRTFNDELDINSPSKESYKSGVFFGEGLIRGLASYENKVSRAGASVADHAMSGLNNAVSTVYDLISNGIDAEPTIRPVLDLSAVSAGANQINGMLSMNPSIGAMANVAAINSMMSGRQNGSNSDVVSAIKDLGASLSGNAGVTNNYINGVSNGDGNVADAIGIIVSAAMRERRT